MTVVEHLERARKSGRPALSLEVLPPIRGENIASLFKILDELVKFKPSFINITYHQHEIKKVVRPNGTITEKLIRKRPGTVGVCSTLFQRYSIDTVAHILCANHSKEELEDIFIELDYLGINNILALRGDYLKGSSEKVNEVNKNSYPHAIELVKQIQELNAGIFSSQYEKKMHAMQFHVGVAGYPEKHFEAPSLEEDIARLKEKIDAGANYVITQMFFDNQYFYSFVKKCRAAGITVPIIPGLKPLTTFKQMQNIPKLFHCTLPEEMLQQLKKIDPNDTDAFKKIGANWCTQQALDLIDKGADCLHFYTMSRDDVIKNILQKIF